MITMCKSRFHGIIKIKWSKWSGNPAKRESWKESVAFLFYKQSNPHGGCVDLLPMPPPATSHLSPSAPCLVSSLPEMWLSGVQPNMLGTIRVQSRGRKEGGEG
jgi:hypothetical protein